MDRPLELTGRKLRVLAGIGVPDPLRIDVKFATRRVVQNIMIET